MLQISSLNDAIPTAINAKIKTHSVEYLDLVNNAYTYGGRIVAQRTSDSAVRIIIYVDDVANTRYICEFANVTKAQG